MEKKEGISVTIDKKILKEFRTFCDEECRNYSRIIEKLMKEYLEKNGRKSG